MWTVNKYLTQGSAKQQEFPNRAGDGHKSQIHAHSERTHTGREPCGHSRRIGWVLKCSFILLNFSVFQDLFLSHTDPAASILVFCCLVDYEMYLVTVLCPWPEKPSDLLLIFVSINFFLNLTSTFPVEQEQIYIPSTTVTFLGSIYFLSLCSQGL